MSLKPISIDCLREDLKTIRLCAGNALIVHASLKSIGPISGGAEALLGLFEEALGEAGLMAMPVFTYSLTGLDKYPPFDPVRSVSRTGALTEVFRTLPGTVRSLHPTHSVAARGRDAAKLVADHERLTALGADSPFHRMAERDARILLIGCGFDSLSLIHTGEVLANAWYRDQFCWQHAGWKPRARVAAPGGSVREVELREVPGCSKSFFKLEPVARQEGLVHLDSLGAAAVMTLSARRLLRLIARVLEREPDFLLCAPGACPACDERRNSRRGTRQGLRHSAPGEGTGPTISAIFVGRVPSRGVHVAE
jgi:aminoglycoside 3-N-acetyltransferase